MFEMFVGSKFKFMEKRRVTYMISVAMVLASIGILVVKGGPKESIDFTGGNVLYVAFDQVVPVESVRSAADGAQMLDPEVQMAEGGTQSLIHYRVGEETDASRAFDRFKETYEASNPDAVVSFMSTETVGPKIGKELEKKAGMAIFWSLILILIYVAWRFTRVSFGLGAVAALSHDILIVLGVFTLLGREVSLTVVAAFLTIGGYSINDTIVVFDRIRENMGLVRRMSFQEIVNKSVNQTLSRTVLTSGTTLLAVLALYFLGGVVLRDFAFAMLLGVIIGTYSSIFVASALALDLSNWWIRRKQERDASAKGKTRAKAKAKTKTAGAH